MGEINPLEFLENQILNNENKEDVENNRVSKLEEFLSDEESIESEDSYDYLYKKRKNKNKDNKSNKVKTDQFGRKIRYQKNIKKYDNHDLKNKLKTNKKYEMYIIRKMEYEKDKNKRESEIDNISNKLSAIDRMAFRREQILKKHSEKFINDLKKSKE